MFVIMENYLPLSRYIELARKLVLAEFPKFVNDEDVISSVVEMMVKADDIYRPERCKATRNTFRRFWGRNGIKRALERDYNPRYIKTRQRRKEILNFPKRQEVTNLEECTSNYCLSDKIEYREIYNYVETLREEIKNPFVSYYFLGNTKTSICEMLRMSPKRLNKLLEEGLECVREKFNRD